MANEIPCGQCKHFDPILRGKKETRRGACIKRSVYPAINDPMALPPPAGAKTAEVAKMDIRLQTEVVGNCLTAAPLDRPRDKGARLLKHIESKRHTKESVEKYVKSRS